MAVSNEATTGYADVQGARLYYEVAGAGHPLIMLHEGIANLHFWDDQWEPFARAYRVVRYDIRGFGKSIAPPGSSNMRDDLVAVMRALGIDHAYLMGASIGGGIIVDFALEHPEMVDALVPVVPGLSGGPPPTEEEMRQFQEVKAAQEAGDLDRVDEIFMHLWIDGPGRTPEQVNPAVRARIRQMLCDNRDAENAEEKPAPLDPPASGRLSEIHVPTLVIAGDADVPGILVNADILAEGIPGARKVVMHGVAHALNMEQPEAFNRIVLDFLHDVEAASSV